MFATMTEREFSSLPDDAPLADAIEQMRPAAEDALVESVDPDERVPLDEGDSPPLESNPADWQEQRLTVDDPDDDR